MEKKDKITKALVYTYVIFSILLFVLVLIIPITREKFEYLSSNYPYIMGFIKFALLATAGELIASYIISVNKTVPVKIVWRFIIWGLIGVWISFMMKVFSTAATNMMTSGTLPGGDNNFLRALYTSVLMNTSFGPTFMAVHKMTDKILELSAKKEKITMVNVVTGIDWNAFFGFTILKTVPLFWIPAHTVTFLLPPQYQVMMAAALSVALGVFLSLNSRKKIKEN
ncbi:MAG: Mpv17/PMP22 family protein [Clostridia bacterium]|nr:Mpv17/PMP22 family protein [Clostridia bacterium]